MNNQCGTLYVVATPIGNLQDMSQRAIEVLKKVDLIAAEDTRHSATLLKHYSIQKPTVSCHNWNEREQLLALIAQLRAGKSVALISDAGTPLISDPGFNLVKAAYEADISVVPIPGACALIAALSASPLPTDQFYFAGFLPSKSNECRGVLKTLENVKATLVFYEAPHRLLQTLNLMAEIFGQERQISVARELTKLHETIKVGSISEVLSYFENAPDKIRGEIVMVIEGTKIDVSPDFVPEKVLDILLSELPLKQAVKLASLITGERKNTLYNIALNKKTKGL